MLKKMIFFIVFSLLVLSAGPISELSSGDEHYFICASADNRIYDLNQIVLDLEEAENMLSDYLICRGASFGEGKLNDEIMAGFAVNYCYYQYFTDQYKERYKDVKNKNGYLYFSQKHIDTITQQFFDKTIKAPNKLGKHIYKNGYYIRALADGNMCPTIKITDTVNKGSGCFEITGNLFDEMDERIETEYIQAKVKYVMKNENVRFILTEFRYIQSP